MLAEVFELGESLDSETLCAARVFGHVVEVDLLDVHGVVLLQNSLRSLDEPRHSPADRQVVQYQNS